MAFQNPDREKIREILQDAKTIAVVGLSDNPERESYMVADALQKRGYRIIPVNPNVKTVLGEKSYPSLLDIKEPVDIVDVFRRSEFVKPIAKEAVEIKAKTLWLQEGVYNEEAARIAQEGGLNVVMDLCIKVMDAILQPKKGSA